MTTPASEGPLFSVISACYQVASFLPEFIESIDAQDFDATHLEVVMVDDGSSDETPALLAAWAARRPDLVKVVRQANGGQGSARNAGIEAATGAWLTFPDPDDILDPDYFSRVADFIAEHPQADMVATNRWLLNDTTKALTETHPLRRHFQGGDQLKNLARDERFFHGSAPATFFRSERIAALGLRYDTRIRPNFEDGHFCSSYLLDLAAPQVGFVASARYQYRKRQDLSSTLQTAMTNPGRYTAVLRHGYLDLLTRGRDLHGRAPLWLQNFILYELNYYLGKEDSQATGIAPEQVREEFHDLMGQIVAHLDPHAVTTYNPVLTAQTRDIILHAYSGAPWVSDRAQVTAVDEQKNLVQITYRFTGELPEEIIEFGEQHLVPEASKIRDVMVHDRALVHERILWVPARRVRLLVGGEYLYLEETHVPPAQLTLRPTLLPASPKGKPKTLPAPAAPIDKERKRVLRRATSRRNVQRFADAWVLVDRVHNADDSAEHLFAWLQRNRPKVNSFFVIEKGTPDWHRLRAAHGKRVVAYGSDEWVTLMLNAKHLISSHADVPIAFPSALAGYKPWPWKFTFLQHGVIKDDLSGWLNHRPLDLFVTSTEAEYASVVADHTTYLYTEKEVALTGLPRFDRLHRAGRRVKPNQRDLILVSPTWRAWLVPPLASGSQRRESIAEFEETEYMQNWLAFLRSDELHRVAKDQGVGVAVLPHPNMEANLDLVDLPDHVERLTFDGTDVREVFARAAVLVTDYSSTAFNAAYIRRPVVYFQFDAEQMLGGGHIGRAGYFEYERDGFGPVASTLSEAVEATVQTLEAGREPAPQWAARIDATFPFNDDKCCVRVFNAIRAMDKKVRVRTVQDAPEDSPTPEDEDA